jgi:hypothetical protein
LVKLSRDAAAGTKRIERLTWALIFLTVVLCVLALPSAYDFYEKKYLQFQNNPQPAQDQKLDPAAR